MALSIQLIVIIGLLTFNNYIYLKKNMIVRVLSITFFLLLFIPTEIQGIISGTLYSAPRKI